MPAAPTQLRARPLVSRKTVSSLVQTATTPGIARAGAVSIRDNPPIRERRADDPHVQLMRKRKICGEPSSSGHKRGILQARHRHAQAALFRSQSIFVYRHVFASQLSQTTYQSGSGTDTLWVRVSDGSQWSPWSQSFTVTAPIDTGPTVVPTNTNVSAAHNQSFAASSLFIASDPFNDAITQYDFWNMGTGGGLFLLNNQVLGASQENCLGLPALPDHVSVRLGDGHAAGTVGDGSQWSPWSQSLTVTAPTDTGPVVTSVSNINTIAGQTFVASNLFTASDPFGDAIEQYDFWDTASGGGRFMLNDQALATNQDNVKAGSGAHGHRASP